MDVDVNNLRINLGEEEYKDAWKRVWDHLKKDHYPISARELKLMQQWLHENYSCSLVEEPGNPYWVLKFHSLADRVAFDLTWKSP